MPPPEPIPDLLKAVNDSSARGFALWVTFLTVGTYLAIAIGTTTHLQLLLEAPVKLPLLGVDLPLFAFYLFAPPLFLLLHFYVLMQFYLLSRTIRQFDTELRRARMFEFERKRVRVQLDAFVLTRMLLGGPDRFLPRQFLRGTVWITLLAGPIALLLFFQLRFLPYHSVSTTWVHRAVLLLDIAMLSVVWPWIAHGDSAQPRAPTTFAWLGALGAMLAVFAVLVATIPDEGIEAWQPPWPTHLENQTGRRVWWPTWALFEGNIEPENSATDSLFGRNLVLMDMPLIGLDDEQLSKRDRTLSLRNRDLRYALFWRSDLRKADLSYADLQHANLSLARLENARLDQADLRGASFNYAQAQGALLVFAQMQEASFNHTHLQGAKFDSAQMQGADLMAAELQGASLVNAAMQGAWLRGANMQGASLNAAQMSGADLASAQMQDASLVATQMQGVSLDDAQMQGAWLVAAQMQGATLEHTRMDGSSLQGASVWRATLTNASTANVDARGATLAPMSPHDVTALLDFVRLSVPGGRAEGALQRLGVLQRQVAADQEPELQAPWLELMRRSANSAPDEGLLAATLAGPACAVDSAPYVARGLLQRIALEPLRPYVPLLARALRDPGCAGARGLTPVEIARLDAIVAAAGAATSSPVGAPGPVPNSGR